ncbi:MAG TPA: VOC family protein [Gordonia sp. (in: high G+C Gram-positive bacteria)]|uniref:VOC family protein n=1 Tax=unclassified Gordonia (in: high G+C Gram-positive bacteria) TaxID=2657482 RepID=UPI0025B85661|nr:MULTISPECIES: VOC family protein [unclassified Gordonia (in: high G+C Gram-positive bacteria)]HNP56229.1 VOC family protein [Gordonia sp. (in: high G+C Gram-positive bacteria)]HRC51732.1 VOC family protein [Gordonia sp. (in: high G+C Gram-positive bacteria)]
MTAEAQARDPHSDIHSEEGALRGEHAGRSANPLVKVRGLAWLEFAKPDLVRAEAFARAFGFETACRTTDTLYLRGADAGSPCVVIRKGRRTRFLGPAFQAADGADVVKVANSMGVRATPIGEPLGGVGVSVLDPSGMPLRVVADVDQLPAIGAPAEPVFNFGSNRPRTNTPVRPPRTPARVQRLGHVVLMTSRYRESLQWYLDTLGLIVSDFLFYEGQRDRGPVMSFIRCDRGSEPADHHTLAMTLGPSNKYVHSAYEVSDLDTIAAGGEYLNDLGYHRSWGIGRHIQGSQIFDYWRDPDGFLVEHYADGDLFDSSLEPGWAPMTASGLAQWGPPATPDFLGTTLGREALETLRDSVTSLHNRDNEFDLRRLRGLLKVPTS